MELHVFSTLWANKDRYAYVYQPAPGRTGIVRTVQQPMGLYARELVGLSSNVKLFGGALSLNGNVTQSFLQNKAPYYSDFNRLSFGIGANWYAGNFTLGLSYKSSDRASESNKYNTVVKTKDFYVLSAG